MKLLSSLTASSSRRVRISPPCLCTRVLASTRSLHTKIDLISDLEQRGFVQQITSREKCIKSLETPRAVYLGVDPTAEYLHVGHLLPLMTLFHFQLRGHKTIPLIGGATGLVGDPSGRDTERPLSDGAKVEHNVQKLSAAVLKFLSGAGRYATKKFPNLENVISTPEIKSNLEWFKGMGLLEFLRTVGLHARVNTMIARESVSARLASQQGISFTEFSYQLLQAYDFYILHKNAGCSVQIGGSDQWGNILAGIDLINKLDPEVGKDGSHEEKVFGVTTPLLTTPSGAKFGKSAGNAVALDRHITSVFDFYQFFLRTPDSHVGKYLKLFTLLPLEDIENALQKHNEQPETRSAQRLLADEVTELVHGEQGVIQAKFATKILYESDLTSIKTQEVLDALEGDSRLHVLPENELLETTIVKLAVNAKLVSSNSGARQLISSKGLYVNNKPVGDVRQKIEKDELLDNRVVVVRAGSQKQVVLVSAE
ncbi:Tyrosine--tRNA ligase [Abortiporus biennis]